MKDSNNIGLVNAAHPDRESWARPDDKLDLRLWLRLLTCSTLVENRLRTLMRNDFAMTLPRFDLMAQLASAPRGMKMSELSRSMMVTNGNITGIVDQLEQEGYVERLKVDTDRRSSLIRLTAEGRRKFRGMSRSYRAWVGELFEPLSEESRQQLFNLLGELKEAGRSASTPA